MAFNEKLDQIENLINEKFVVDKKLREVSNDHREAAFDLQDAEHELEQNKYLFQEGQITKKEWKEMKMEVEDLRETVEDLFEEEKELAAQFMAISRNIQKLFDENESDFEKVGDQVMRRYLYLRGKNDNVDPRRNPKFAELQKEFQHMKALDVYNTLGRSTKTPQHLDAKLRRDIADFLGPFDENRMADLRNADTKLLKKTGGRRKKKTHKRRSQRSSRTRSRKPKY